MKDRIILLIKAKNLTAAQFADEIGVQKSSISHIISGRNNASLDFIQKVLLTYPEVNMEWLMFGKGPLFRTNETTLSSDDGSLNSIPPVDLAHVDLFSELIPAKSADFRKENNLISDEIPEENFKQEEVKGNEARITEPKNTDIASTEFAVRKNETEEVIPGHRKSATKAILKIVEFYSDNTYKEYFPGN